MSSAAPSLADRFALILGSLRRAAIGRPPFGSWRIELFPVPRLA